MTKRRMRNPNELFVGDLSYFCRECHLIHLFSKYGNVSEVRIKRNDVKGKTLMYGFVRLDNIKSALAAATELNNSIFMGRRMK
jgi:RNA recognition motif-containing protein